jgi:serine/threonine-protein kinase
MSLLTWVLMSHHVPTKAELKIFSTAVREASFIGGGLWVIYLALEPYVRRRWPQTIIGWSRILSGRLRDPLVGADLLVGVIAGIGWTLVFQVHEVVMQRLGHPAWWTPSLDVLLGARQVAGYLLIYLPQAIANSLSILFVVLGVGVLVSSRWLAGLFSIAGLIFVTVTTTSVSGPPLFAALLWLLFYAGVILVLLRFGLVALIVGFFVLYVLRSSMVTGDLSSWYGGTSVFVLVGVLAIAIYGFYTALYSRPLFR